jgi:hypothetical protein
LRELSATKPEAHHHIISTNMPLPVLTLLWVLAATDAATATSSANTTAAAKNLTNAAQNFTTTPPSDPIPDEDSSSVVNIIVGAISVAIIIISVSFLTFLIGEAVLKWWRRRGKGPQNARVSDLEGGRSSDDVPLPMVRRRPPVAHGIGLAVPAGTVTHADFRGVNRQTTERLSVMLMRLQERREEDNNDAVTERQSEREAREREEEWEDEEEWRQDGGSEEVEVETARGRGEDGEPLPVYEHPPSYTTNDPFP